MKEVTDIFGLTFEKFFQTVSSEFPYCTNHTQKGHGQMNLSTKQKTQMHREHTGGCQEGGGWERGMDSESGVSSTNYYIENG